MEDVFIHNEYPSQSVRYLSTEGKFLVDYGIL